VVVLEENELARAQTAVLVLKTTEEFQAVLKGGAIDSEKIAFLKRALGAYQLIAYNFLGNVFGLEATNEIIRDILLPILASTTVPVVELRVRCPCPRPRSRPRLLRSTNMSWMLLV